MEDLKTLEYRINDDLNCVFETYSKRDSVVFDNLWLLKKFFLQVEDVMFELHEKFSTVQVDYAKTTKMDFMEKANLIDEFFSDLKIPFDFRKMLTDGTFNVNTTSKKTLSDSSISDGYYRKKDNHFDVSVINRGLSIDAIVWLHEITHYRHLKDGVTISAHYLSESFAFAYEFIFLDYLYQKGYQYEATIVQTLEAVSLFRNLYECYYILKMFILYSEFGTINEENYKALFNSDDYAEVLERYFKIVEVKTVSSLIKYSLAAPLAIYMYEEYRKDNSFLKNIEDVILNSQNKTIEECLPAIGIVKYNETGFDDDSNIEKIKQSIEGFKDELDLRFKRLDDQKSI